MTPFMQLLVKLVRSAKAAGLPREPKGASKTVGGDWESLGRDVGQAVRRFRGGGKPGT